MLGSRAAAGSRSRTAHVLAMAGIVPAILFVQRVIKETRSERG
jgi:hypothetical protein